MKHVPLLATTRSWPVKFVTNPIAGNAAADRRSGAHRLADVGGIFAQL